MTATMSSDAGDVDYLDGSNLSYESAAHFCAAAKIGGTMADVRAIYAPGEDDGGTQYFGLRSITVELDLIYVCASESDCVDLFSGDMLVLAGGVFQMAVGGQTFNGCYLAAEPKSSQPKSTGVAPTFRMDASVQIKCVQPGA